MSDEQKEPGVTLRLRTDQAYALARILTDEVTRLKDPNHPGFADNLNGSEIRDYSLWARVLTEECDRLEGVTEDAGFGDSSSG